jgi:FkbM family methyltransferase
MINKITKLFGYTIIKTSYFKDVLITERKKISNSHLHSFLKNNFFKLIKTTELNVSHILDVGANRGDWTRAALEYFPHTSITMVEPQTELNSHFGDLMANPNVRVFNIGLGSQTGIGKFTIAEVDDASTFRLSEADAAKAGLRQIDVDIKTIDDFLKENHLSIPEIIKIDAEGLDLEVLSGATAIYGKTEVIIVEAAVMASGLGNRVEKVIRFLEERGYRLFDILDLNRPINGENKYLMLVELAFIKNQGMVDNYYSNI